MLTEFGKVLRDYRINHNMLLYDMANELRVGSAYLASIEVGKREMPDNIAKDIKRRYNVTYFA